MKQTEQADNFLLRWMAYICSVIIALLPFHAFLTVWLASGVGHYTALRLWKEALLLPLVGGAIYMLTRRRWVRQSVRRDPLVWAILIYLVFLLLSGLISGLTGAVKPKALAYGLLLDGRYLAFFLVSWLVSQRVDLLVRWWQRLVLVPAAGVVGFATLQWLVLPSDFLRHFGYGPSTIAPSATVDQKADYQRIQSTLRGANPFGAYLIIVLGTIGARLARYRHNRWVLASFYALGFAALYFTYSRSAWLGVFAATAWLAWGLLRDERSRRLVLLTGAAAVLVFAAVGYGLRDNDYFQNLVFHTDEKSRSAVSSNAGHMKAVREGLSDIMRQPQGGGPGSAGPASFYNGQARIAENYYVQIGQELGMFGLGMFIAINVIAGVRLWRGRQHLLNQVLLASLIGLTVVSMLLHVWADDSIAYIWWGLAGAALGYPLGVSTAAEESVGVTKKSTKAAAKGKARAKNR